MMKHLWLLLLPLTILAQDSPFARPKPSAPKPEAGPAADPAQKDDRPALDADARAQLAKLIREYWDGKDDAREGILAEVEKIDAEFAVAKKDIDGFLREMQSLAQKGSRHMGGNGRVRYSHPEHNGEYIIDASAAGGGKVALWISLHGGGQGSGDPGANAPRLGGVPGAAIKVYPAVKEKTDTAWNTEREERWVLELIQGLRRSFNIDSNRIYLVGHSMGGFGTWSIGCNHADLFAGMAPMAGGLFPRDIIANLKNTPVYFYHSTDDKQVGPKSDQENAKALKELKDQYGPYEYIYKEYNDIGHGYPRDGVAPIYAWIGAKTRNPYPKHVIWAPYRSYKKTFFWLKVGSVGRRGGRIEAKIESGNRIFVEGNADGLSILINDKMGISMSREVVVTRGGQEVYRGPARYSVAALLETFEQKRDLDQYFYAKVPVN
jgi:predicted esterase